MAIPYSDFSQPQFPKNPIHPVYPAWTLEARQRWLREQLQAPCPLVVCPLLPIDDMLFGICLGCDREAQAGDWWHPLGFDTDAGIMPYTKYRTYWLCPECAAKLQATI